MALTITSTNNCLNVMAGMISEICQCEAEISRKV